MHRVAAAALTVLALATTARAAETQKFGKPLKGLEPTKLSQVLAKPEDGKTVRVEGTIAKVCLKKGCWLELQQDDQAVHVTFEGYSFFVPKDSAGSKVTLEGTVKVSEPDPDHVEHLKGEGAGEAAAKRVSIEATGVEIAASAK